MKTKDTPQQPHIMFNGETKGIYAINEHGEYELTRTSGWQPETEALSSALEEIDRLSSDALQRAREGQCSPLEYHMYKQRLDTRMLAQAIGKFQWQVRRHLSPKGFSKLSKKLLSRYADILDINVSTLTQLPND